jgi:hypothetical protein
MSASATERDREQIYEALARWFYSQDVSRVNAGYVMKVMVGAILADLAVTEEHLDEGLRLVHAKIERCARNAFKSKVGKRA